MPLYPLWFRCGTGCFKIFPAANGANVTGNKNLNAGACFLPDAAFLAREKARADAECYTAMKVAEANKVLLFPYSVP